MQALKVRYSDLPILYPNGSFSPKIAQLMQNSPEEKTNILEVICKDYSKINEDAFLSYVIEMGDKDIISFTLLLFTEPPYKIL